MRILFNTYRINPNYQNYSANNKNKSVPITFSGGFNYEAEYERIRHTERNRFERFMGIGKKADREKVNERLIGFNLNREQNEKQKQETIDAKQKEIEALEKSIQISREKEELLKQQLDEAKKNNLSKEDIEKIKADIANEVVEQMKAKSAYKTNKENLEKTIAIQDLLTSQKSGTGWAKIAGHDGENGIKKQLEGWFINKLALEQGGNKVTMPNSILFYGPRGTGKTFFAQAFAEQAKCNYVEVDTLQSNDDIMTDLRTAAKAGRNLYESSPDKKRTIVLLDEFDSISHYTQEELKEIKAGKPQFDEDFNIVALKKFLKDCAEKYKTTVFMTTNYPLNIESQLFEEGCIPATVYLGPPENENVTALFKYYLKDATNQPLDYQEFTSKIMEYRKKDTAFSAGCIAKMLTDLISSIKETGQQITQNDVIKAIAAKGPDINKEMLDRFIREVEIISKKLHV